MLRHRRFGADVDYSSTCEERISDAILDDIIRRGPAAFQDLLVQLDRMSASDRAVSELFSAVNSLLSCFYGNDTTDAWLEGICTLTSELSSRCRRCSTAHSFSRLHDDTEDAGFGGDSTLISSDEIVEISLSYRDTDTGLEVDADHLPEPTSVERRLFKQRYRPQIELSLYETCMADGRRLIDNILFIIYNLFKIYLFIKMYTNIFIIKFEYFNIIISL